MDTSLYYTFSTIAQAFAGAMALLAAFAMYKLKAITDECFQSIAAMESETGGGISSRVLAIASDWEGALGDIERRLQQPGRQPVEMQDRRNRVRLLVAAHRRVLTALWIALAATAVLVAGSIGVLAYVPRIVASCKGQMTLLAGVGSTVLCLVTYLWLVFRTFRDVR